MVESVLLAGGGTAGHVNPLLAVADELRDRGVDRITVLGTAEGLESDLVPSRGYPLAVVPRVPLPRRPGPGWVALPSRLRAAVRAAGEAIDAAGAQAVVGFGGYVATPAYVAARRRGIPIVVHEQNARPGVANRLGARWAAAVAVTFPGTPLRGARVTGLPLRHEIVDLLARRALDPVAVRREALAELGLSDTAPVLVVTGGSLGAQSLNEAMTGALGAVEAADVQVLHLTGRGKADEVRAALADHPGLTGRYEVREYLEQMHLALAVADLVLCRSGAGTVAELTALGIPAAYVPLPIGNGEQQLNAQPAVDAGGGLIVQDAALTPEWIGLNVLPLLADAPALAELSVAAARVGRTDGASAVADLVMDLVPGEPA